jgi:hypothetical protein
VIHARGEVERELGKIQIIAGLSDIYQQLWEKAFLILGQI